MKKFLAMLLCAALMLSLCSFAAADEPVHITFSFWGSDDEAAAVQANLDAYNAMQDKVFVEAHADS